MYGTCMVMLTSTGWSCCRLCTFHQVHVSVHAPRTCVNARTRARARASRYSVRNSPSLVLNNQCSGTLYSPGHHGGHCVPQLQVHLHEEEPWQERIPSAKSERRPCLALPSEIASGWVPRRGGVVTMMHRFRGSPLTSSSILDYR